MTKDTAPQPEPRTTTFLRPEPLDAGTWSAAVCAGGSEMAARTGSRARPALALEDGRVLTATPPRATRLDAFIAAWNIPPPGSDLARVWWVRSRELRALGTARGRHRPSASCVCCTECVRRSRRARSSAKALATPRGPHGRAWQGKQLRPTLALYLIVNRWRRMDVGES